MELIFILMSTAVGTVMGSVAGVFTAQRINRSPSAEAAALKLQLRASEASLAEAVSSLETVRTQLTDRERALEARAAELKTKQDQLDSMMAGAAGLPLRPIADPGAGELALRAAALIEQCTELETRAKEEKNRVAEEASRHISVLEAELAGARAQLQECTAQLGNLKAAVGESHQSRLDLEAELARERERAGELSAENTRLSGELAELREQRASEETQASELQQRHAGLGAELDAEQQRSRDLAAQVVALQAHVAELEASLDDERKSAAKGMALLTLAQDNLARVFQALAIEQQNGNGEQINGNGHKPLDSVPAAALIPSA